MSDKKIIKALECCVSMDGNCRQKNCPAIKECGKNFMFVEEQALSLINRQKAEKEALIAGQKTLQKYIAEQKAEIERLEAEIDKQYEQAKADILGNMADGGTSCHWCIEQHRAVAIKEFAERLERVVAVHNGDMWSKYEYIDSLVKEMVGDSDA